jgi:hypothetical protein
MAIGTSPEAFIGGWPQITIIADAALQQDPKSQSLLNVNLPQEKDEMTVSKMASSEF